MKRRFNIALLLAFIVFGFSVNSQAISLTVGTGDFYVNVGDYDYLPYAYTYGGAPQIPGLSFQSAMADYGMWTTMRPFGQVWRPYVAQDWRPYTYGHWVYTQYGPTWQGYEPWAWAGYHYGNWVYSQQLGWVWIPGYEWHPGRVAWSSGFNSVGWMPIPPSGYDYSRGYLSYIGPQNQFAYYDDDFSIGFSFGGGDYYYGGPYYDPRYRNLYYSPSYLNIAGLLWTFLDPTYFLNDNYADYYYGGDYARFLFDRRLIRISTRPIERVFIERAVQRSVPVRQVRTNQVRIDGRTVRVAAIEGEQDKIKRHANETVKEVIAPAFAQRGKNFKGEKARNRDRLERALKIENAPRRVETVTTEEITRQARERAERREKQRAERREKKRQEVAQVEKQGRIKERKDRDVRQTGAPPRTQQERQQQQQQERRETQQQQQERRETQKQQQRERRETQQQQQQERRETQQQRRTPPPKQQQEQQEDDEARRGRPAQQQQQQEQRDRRLQQQEQQQERREQQQKDRRRPNQQQQEDDDQRKANPSNRATPRSDTQRDVDQDRRQQQKPDVRETQTEREQPANQKKDAKESDTKQKSKSNKSKGKEKDKEKDKDKENQDEPPQE